MSLFGDPDDPDYPPSWHDDPCPHCGDETCDRDCWGATTDQGIVQPDDETDDWAI